MKKWYKGTIEVLYDADKHDDIDVDTQMTALVDYHLQTQSWADLEDMIIGDMEELPKSIYRKVEE